MYHSEVRTVTSSIKLQALYCVNKVEGGEGITVIFDASAPSRGSEESVSFLTQTFYSLR